MLEAEGVTSIEAIEHAAGMDVARCLATGGLSMGEVARLQERLLG